MEDLAAFTNDLHGYLMSAGAVKPSMRGVGGPAATGSAQTRTGAAPTQPGEPLRTGRTTTGVETTAK